MTYSWWQGTGQRTPASRGLEGDGGGGHGLTDGPLFRHLPLLLLLLPLAARIRYFILWKTPVCGPEAKKVLYAPPGLHPPALICGAQV